MPTYDYLCKNCEVRFEEFQSITANALRKCPDCGEMELKRLIGAGAGVIFKGSGFYETDYRSDGYKDAAKKETSKTTDKKEATGKKDSGETKSKKTSDESKTTAAKTSDSSSPKKEK